MSLQRKILTSFIVISILINILFLLNFIRTKKNNELDRLDRKISNSCELLNQVNSGPLYDYDVEKIKTNIQSFLKDPEIVSITLNEINNNVHVHYEDPEYKSKYVIEKKIEITYNNEKIGDLTILFTTFELYKRINQTIRDLLISFTMIIFLVAALLYVFINKMLKPVADLTEVAAEIANGNLDKSIEIKTSDEIGILARSFETMQNSIKQKITSLKIENEKREQTLLRSRRQQAAILKIASSENLDLTWVQMVKLVTETAASAMDIERTSIWNKNKKANSLLCQDLFLKSENSHQKIGDFDLNIVPAYHQAMNNNTFVAASDAKTDIRTRELGLYLQQFDIYSMLDVPIKIQGNLVGVICFEKTGEQHIWTSDECVFAERVGDQIANYLVENEKKEILNALKESEERFHLLTTNLKSVMIYQIILNEDGTRKFTYVSPNILEINGVSQEEVLYDPYLLYSQIDEEFKDAIMAAEIKALKELSTFEFEVKVHVPGKTNQWRQLVSTPRKLENGQVIWDGVQIDLTERKRIEEYRNNINRVNEIILNSDNVDQLQENITNAMFEMYDSDRAWFVKGFENENMYFEVHKVRTKPDYPVAVGTKEIHDNESKANVPLVMKENEPIAFYASKEPKIPQSVQEIRLVKSMIMTYVKPSLGPSWLVGVHQCDHEREWSKEEILLLKDISTKVSNSINIFLYTKEIEKSQKFISNIIDSMPSILIGVDKYGKITQWNREAEKLLNIHTSDAVGKELFNVVHFTEEEYEKIKANMHSKEKLVFSKRGRRENSKMIYENITLFPLIANGIEGAVIRIDDVTERVNMEELMIQSEKMMSIGGLAAGMAHEINNPLAGIIQNAQVLQNRMTRENPANLKFCEENDIAFEKIKTYFHDRKIDKIIDNIMNSGNRAGEIVKNMLTFARLDSESKIKTSIPDIIEKTIDLVSSDYDLKKKYDFRRIEIIRDYSKEVPDVLCSPSKIQQVLLNILKNGAEAMSEKEYNGNEPTFTVRNYLKDSWCVIEIDDNGPGMDKDTQKRIFEPFYTTKDPGVGTGLGLSISYFIITENHKGDMWVESYPGEGTKFFIRLPII